MLGGVVNIGLGIAGIVMGLNGRVLAFTGSKEALMIFGGALIALGCWQLYRSRKP
jgi:hypothetical protein